MGDYLKKTLNNLTSPMGYCVAHNMEKILGRKRKMKLVPDFVRQSSLELCAEEIYKKELSGSVAELGVYKGAFASMINQLFPDRVLYLFDTFEGFDDKDIEIEEKYNYSKNDQSFSDTSVEFVMNKMAHPNNCIIKKGYFPESALDIEDKFVFVSIDTDLYKPIYEGLTFFYPKLVKGGYIFVHDFNNKRYKGARKSVMDYCEENGIAYFPLSDAAGTAIIMK